MTDPKRALEVARARAATMRDAGAYANIGPSVPEVVGPPASQQLLEWALIEPDARELRSTRAIGGVITALRRGLVSLLRHYHASQLGQQSRFNVHVALYVRQLEERVEELERRLS